jgi:CheY-like chemotaxis protein
MIYNKYTILVVDDTEENRKLLSMRLTADGFNVVTASNGQQALDMVHEEVIHLVLLDIMMPEIDGITVLSRIRSESTFDDMPVIIVSAIDVLNVAKDCMRRGANDYITKPYDMALIKQKILQYLKLRPELVDIKKSKPEQLLD